MSDPTMNGTDVFTPFWPGLNVTSLQNNVCYGDLNLCVNSDLYCNVSICDINTLANMKYVPVLGGNAFYAALFALVAIAQLGLGIKYKTWGFMTAAVLGNITEIIGYIGRIMMHNNIFAKNPFLIYLVCLTIAPAFLSASLYLCLARIVVLFGEHLSHLKPRTYTILFMVADFISLLLQAAGGAIASGSTDNNTTQLGINIMIAGLAFQVASLGIFFVCCVDLFFTLRRHNTEWSTTYKNVYSSQLFKLFLFSLSFAWLTIFIRSCYRVAELKGGFSGALANNEAEFMILDGAMVSAAVLVLTVFHPGRAFQGAWDAANFKLRRGTRHLEKNREANEGFISSGGSSVRGTAYNGGSV